MSSEATPSLPPIVCIGASAGGLEAIERFFQSCPADLGVAFVVIQHLSSHYKSMMDDLINRYSSMPVKMIASGMQPQVNTIHLIEAGTTVELDKDQFKTTQKNDGELTLPIDIFLRSLAKAKISNNTAVILSGTGSDGSRGAVALNAAQGFVVAQLPSQAGFDGMPKSVISTGIVDRVLIAEEMPAYISRYLQVGRENGVPDARNIEPIPTPEDQLERIIDKLHGEFGINFNHYKDATVNRRIERRMQVKHIPDFKTYADLIEKDPVEPLALRKELLIPVTNFFRDSEIFASIRAHVINTLIASQAEDEIRIWVAGCSTGEEAYTYAMLFESELRKRSKRPSFKIFATDVNPDVIDYASKGWYPESALRELPSDIAEQYFTIRDGVIQVAQDIRQKVVFAVHNLLTDAPFTKMDLVSCRNTLIYLKNDAQAEVQKRLQFAVKPKGFLVLGKSESLLVHNDFFETFDRKYKIFRCAKKIPANMNSLNFTAPAMHAHHTLTAQAPDTPTHSQIGFIAESQIKKRFTPLSLLVNKTHDVVQIFGDNTSVLRLKPGVINYHIANLLPEKLAPVAVALLYRLNKESGLIHSDVVRIDDTGDKPEYMRLKGWVIQQEDQPTYYVLSFIPVDGEEYIDNNTSLDVSQATMEKIKQLELELTATRESLQSTIEELETTNEELQATNEELMASNEELQSSNEELQSVNEELNTVNAEYHEKVSILNRINADLDAMSLSTGIATIFVDDKLNLTRFSPDASMIFRVREQDLGRPLNEVVNTLDYEPFFDDIGYTLRTGRPKEVEVLDHDGQGYLIRIVSYKLPSTDKFGAAISLIESKSFATYHKIMDALPEHIAVLDEFGTIKLVNDAWHQSANALPINTQNAGWVGCNYLDYSNETVAQGIKQVLAGNQKRFTATYEQSSPSTARWYFLEVKAVDHKLYKAVISHFDVTQWEQSASGEQQSPTISS